MQPAEVSAPQPTPSSSINLPDSYIPQTILSALEKSQSSAAQRQHSRENSNEANDQDDDPGKKKKKRRKVNHACLYCRRSHMTCDEGRPCQRCIKREIAHLCHDEEKSPSTSSKTAEKEKQKTPQAPPQITPTAQNVTPDSNPDSMNGFTQSSPPILSMPVPQPASGSEWPLAPYFFQSENFGNEFSILTDFLESLEDPSLLTAPLSSSIPASQPQIIQNSRGTTSLPSPDNSNSQGDRASQRSQTTPLTPILPAATKKERFLLTAADQESGSRDERLQQVIQAKYEAGLLKPYNYVKGYARLSRWMDRNVSQDSKQQILQPLSVLRPKFRAVAQSLTDIDLVFIEEAFDRLLLDYDRVFSAMGIPACLWRRTGEIYKGNREFAELVGLDDYMLRDGRLCIYELMSEESAVNYWEKYGHVAFDSTQKAVLTSCELRYKPSLTATSSGYATPVAYRGNRRLQQTAHQSDIGFVNCCFSFTIRRDMWGIPSMIVGNFIKC